MKGSKELQVRGDRSTRIDGRDRALVRGPLDLECKDESILRVSGNMTTLVGRHDARRSSLPHVEGQSRLSSSDATELSSEKSVVIRCGDSSIRMTPVSMELRAPSLFLRADTLAVQSGAMLTSVERSAILKADTIALRSKGGALALDAQLQLAAPNVTIGADPEVIDAAIPAAKRIVPTEIALRDSQGKPIPRQRYVLTFDDGSQISGVVGDDGTDRIELQKSPRITWPDLQGK